MPVDREIQEALGRYRLARPQASALRRGGELLGRGSGSSREIQDYREYHPGDDPRHLDWAAYGRSDTPMVRLYREEISPRLQILLDASVSMTAGSPTKPLVARQLAMTLALLSAGLGDAPRIVMLDDERPLRVFEPSEFDRLSALSWEGRASLPDLLQTTALPPAKHARRIVVSDFLYPHDPAALVGRLAVDASALVLIQVLAQFEADPPLLGGRKLVDVESREFDDQRLDEETVANYKRRLRALQRGLAEEARRHGARFVLVVSDGKLDAVCRENLCAAGILEPA